MPVIKDPTPGWMKDENASVMDSMSTRIMRKIAQLAGMDDPQSQAMGLGAAQVLPFKGPQRFPAPAKVMDWMRTGGMSPRELILDALAPKAGEGVDLLNKSQMDNIRSMSDVALTNTLEALNGRGMLASKMGPEWLEETSRYWGEHGKSAMLRELATRRGMKAIK